MDKAKIIYLVRNHPRLFKAGFWTFNHLPWNNSFAKKVKMDVGFSMLRGCKIICTGENNIIEIGDLTRLYNCCMVISGSNNTIHIGSGCYCKDTVFCIEDDNNRISIGDETCFSGAVELAAIEGTTIEIGARCMFSAGIHIRTGDSHSIVQKETRQRINPSCSVRVGDHVWVCRNAMMLKGTQVPSNCVVGASALLCKAYTSPNSVIAGVPAKEVKENIDWATERI